MLQADESVELDWEDSSNAASYQVAYRHAHASAWVDLPAAGAILTVTGSGAAVSGLPYPLNYYFRVRAANAVGTSDWSAESLVTPAPIVGADGCVIAAPPGHLSQYDKHCSAGGIAIVGSDEVSDFAIKLAWNHIMNMLSAHPGVHARMAQAKVNHVLKAAGTYGFYNSYNNVDRQARSNEENLLCYPDEPHRSYELYDVFNHEFGHALHRRGLTSSELNEVRSAYNAAIGDGLWGSRYSSASDAEYFAEAVEFYFSPRTTDPRHTRENRQSLAEYDPRLYRILLKHLPANDWKASCPAAGDAPPPPPAPPAPINLQSSNVTETSLTLTWDVPAAEAANVNLFWVELSPDSNDSWGKVRETGADVTTATFTDLSSGMNYGYRVTAFNGYRKTIGDALSVETLSPLPPPPPAPPEPINLQAINVSKTSLTLTWEVPADEAANVDLFWVEKAQEPDSVWVKVLETKGSVTTATITGLSPGNSYTYRVTAFNGYLMAFGDGLLVETLPSEIATPPPPRPPPPSTGGGIGFGPAPVAPKFQDGFRTTRSVAENARPGDPVGDRVAATHQDDLEITYSLSGTDAAQFTVHEETGQIRIREGAKLDYDTGQSYTVNLTATDSAGFGAIIIVIIEVTEATLSPYDRNGNGGIDREEVVAAIGDYFDGLITKDEVIAVIKLYFGA